jgi:hypothetical protein
MNKHLKSCLGDKKKTSKMETNYDSTNEVDIRKNLEGLSGRRPDIFGMEANYITRKEEINE